MKCSLQIIVKTVLITLILFVNFPSTSQTYAACTPTNGFNCTHLPPQPPGEDFLCSFAGQFYCCTESTVECQGILPEPKDGTFSSIYGKLLHNSQLKPDLGSLSGIISAMFYPAFMFAGLILFIMLIYGGFLFLTAGTNPEQIEKGKKLLSSAFVGFLIIFTSYWITEILEIVFGITILG